MTHSARSRLDGWLTSRVVAIVMVLAMLASTPGLTPSVSAQDAKETSAADDPSAAVEAIPAETSVEPQMDQAPVEEIVVEPEPWVEETPPIDEVVPTETVPAADETLPTDEPAVVEETPVTPEEPTAAVEPTVEPTGLVEETVEPPVAGRGVEPGSPESTDELAGAGADDGGFGAAAVDLTVTQALSPTGSPVAGTSVRVTASWANAGAGAATGMVRYRVFTGSACTGALYAEAGTTTIVATTSPGGSAPASDPVVMNAAGAHSWQASYSGDANYNPATVCTSQTIVKRTPTIALSVAPSPSVAGNAQTGTSNLANLTTTATGNLTYTLYTNNLCDAVLTTTGSPNVKAVSGGVAPASDPITVNVVATVYWRAVYAGDANNNGITSGCVAVVVAKRSPTLGLTVTSTSGVAGQPASAQAALTGATTSATGNLTYTVYSNSTCTTTLALTGNPHTKAVVGGVAPVSNALTINSVTTYWQAFYAGDASNNTATSPCGALTLAKASPTLGLTVAAVTAPMRAGRNLRGTATLSTTATSNAGGTVVYTVYSESACSVVLVAGNSKTVTNRVVPVSSNRLINQAGFVYVRAVYSGNANNNAATSPCVALAVAKASPTIGLTVTAQAVPMKVGGAATAKGTLSTSNIPSTASGTATYTVYTNNACSIVATAVGGNPHAKPVANRTVPTSNALTFDIAATFYWRVAYSGDANNNPASSTCVALLVAKSTPTLALTVVPGSSPMIAGGTATGQVTMTLAGSTAGGTSTYTVYSESTCVTTLAVTGSPSTVTVTNRTVPSSAAIAFPTLGTVYWRATYAGDANNTAATSACVALVINKASPSIALMTSPAGSVSVGTATTGNATLTGASTTAGGAATYTVYSDAACTATLTVSGSPSGVAVVNRTVPNSAAIAFPAAGTVFWRVAYAGDTNNNAATSGCVALAVVRRSPTIGLTVAGSTNPVLVGGTAMGTASLTDASTTASGSVVYTVFTDNLCTTAAAPSKTSTRTVTNAAVANSGPFTFLTAGTFYWSAQYGGDAANNAAASGCVALNVVNPAVVTLNLTVAPATIVVGASARGEASLTGVTATAGGSVVYAVYADSACSTAVSPAKTSTVTVTNGAVPPSTSFPFAQAGTFYWNAVYSGDATNLGDAGPCAVLTVSKASPTISLAVAPSPVKAGSGAVGTATLAAASSTATGTATFTVYANNVCTTQVTPAQSSARTVAAAVAPASAPLTIQVVGTVYWRVDYSGDTNNNPATSGCLAVVVSKATPAVSLSLSPSTIDVWGTAGASAALSGATTAAGGTVVYTVYANDVCSTPVTPVKSSSRTVAGGVVPASATFMFTGAGIVYWQAAYGGDGNNLDARSGCVPLTVVGGTLTVSVASVTMAPVGYSDTERSNAGVMSLSVVDRRGTSEGWSVTLSVSDFLYAGASPTGASIPAGSFAITTAYGPVYVQGQAIDGASGPLSPGGATGPLDEPIIVLVASDGFGAGEYTQSFDVALTIPGGSQVGTYTAVIDSTTSAAP